MSSIPTTTTISLLLLLPTLLYIFRARLRNAIIPRGLNGIPTLKTGVPIWGDIPMMGKMIGDHDSFSYFFDWMAKELGPIGQVRVGWFMK
jgi:hypothetical protein